MLLGSLARARGFRLVAFGEVDSTNEEAKRLIVSGERGPLWVVADRQTAGRGRLGRDWVSPSGNLHASLIFSDFDAPAVAPQLGFAAGVAAINALKKTASAGRFSLKWPNDLLLDGAKLGGILSEGVSVATGDARAPYRISAVVGIGVNCAHAPADLPYPAKALGALGAGAPSAALLFEALSDAMAETLDIWAGGAGFQRLRELWLAEAAGMGEPITVTLSQGETLKGRFEAVDPSGRLIIVSQEGRRVIDAGDVYLAHAARRVSEEGS